MLLSCVLSIDYVSFAFMDMVNLLMQDKSTLLRLYKEELKNLLTDYDELLVKMDNLQMDINKNEDIVKSLELEIEKEIPDPIERNEYKWRQEVVGYLKYISISATATTIGNYIIARDKVTNIEVAKELRNKIAIACSGLHRDNKIERVGDRKYFYYKLMEETNVDSIGDDNVNELPVSGKSDGN